MISPFWQFYLIEIMIIIILIKFLIRKLEENMKLFQDSVRFLQFCRINNFNWLMSTSDYSSRFNIFLLRLKMKLFLLKSLKFWPKFRIFLNKYKLFFMPILIYRLKISIKSINKLCFLHFWTRSKARKPRIESVLCTENTNILAQEGIFYDFSFSGYRGGIWILTHIQKKNHGWK